MKIIYVLFFLYCIAWLALNLSGVGRFLISGIANFFGGL